MCNAAQVAAVLACLATRLLAHERLQQRTIPQPVGEILDALQPAAHSDAIMRDSLASWHDRANSVQGLA